jgi:glutamine synthetase
MEFGDTFNIKTAPEGFTFAEYIWIDGSGEQVRGKTKVIKGKVTSIEELDWWTYDGSSTNQATTEESEIWLKPVFMCPDPFREGFGIIVLCEGYLQDRTTPARANFRYLASKVMKETEHEDPWFGVEQEYFLLNPELTITKRPLGWPERGLPTPQGDYYCSAGSQNSFGRLIAETHLRLCVKAGLTIAGINAEVAPGQWEFQCGIARGIQLGDHMWVSRYILNRVAELYGAEVNIQPKPVNIKGWNGSGCHTNYSTKSTRADGGWKTIEEHLKRLGEAHKEHISVYGRDNHMRLTGKYETSSMEKFSWGTGNRAASVRIPVGTEKDQKGYYEDRRPASNMDPYVVSAILVDTTILEGKYRKEIVKAVETYHTERAEFAGEH